MEDILKLVLAEEQEGRMVMEERVFFLIGHSLVMVVPAEVVVEVVQMV